MEKDRGKTKEQLLTELNELRKRGDDALQESEERFKQFFDKEPNYCYMISTEGTILDINQAALDVLGYEKEQLMGKPLETIYAPESLPKMNQLFERWERTGVLNDEEMVIISKEGNRRTVLLSVNTVRNTGGEVLYSVSVQQDITEFKRMDEALQESEAYLRAFGNALPDLAFILDEKGCYIEILTGAETLLYREAIHVVGQTLHDVLPKEVADLGLEATRRAIETRETQSIEYQLDVPLGLRLFEARLSPMSSNASNPNTVAIIVRDITERKQAEERAEQLYDSEQKLRYSLQEELERRVEFTRALVHELKTPLVPIIALSELLVANVHEEELLTVARNIQKGASTLNSRIDTLLDLARGELGMLELKYSRVDILKLLREVTDTMSPVASSREFSLVLNAPSSLPLVLSDKERLEQVILNLLSNAYNWSPRGAKVTLTVKEKKNALIMEVHDLGLGIAKNDQQRIFEAYYRRINKGQRVDGLGLGLALCKTIVEAHGGNIWVKSKKGRGSTFGFSLPLLTDVA